MENDFKKAFIAVGLVPPELKSSDKFTYTSEYEGVPIKIDLYSLELDNKYAVDNISVKGLSVSSFKEMAEAVKFHVSNQVNSSDGDSDSYDDSDESWGDNPIRDDLLDDEGEVSWEYNLEDDQLNDLKECLIKASAKALHSGVNVKILAECKGFKFSVEYQDTNSLLFTSSDNMFKNDYLIDDFGMESFITGNVFEHDAGWLPMYEAYADFLGQKTISYG